MKLQQNKTKKSPFVFLIVVVAIGLLVGGVFWYNTTLNKTSSTPTTNQVKDDVQKKESADRSTDTDAQAKPEKEKDIITGYEGESVDNNDTLTGVVSYKASVGSELVLRTTINQILGSGTCQLTLKSSSSTKVVMRTANIAANPSSSACEGFNIPLSDLAKGAWNIEIKIQSEDRTGTIKDTVNI